MDLVPSIALVAGAYLVGSIPSSYLVGRLAGGIDIRERGSKNVGASNLTAQAGAWWAAPVVLFDILVKGALPVFIASDKVLGLGLGVEVAAGIAGITSHNWSKSIHNQTNPVTISQSQIRPVNISQNH